MANQYYEAAIRDIDFKRKVSSKTGRPIPRQAAWLTASPCSCEYKYFGTRWEPNKYPIWLEELTTLVMSKCDLNSNVFPNALNINLYESGGSGVGWHSDDEELFNTDSGETVIISLSLGSSRTFSYRRKDSQDDDDDDSHLWLSSGDLLIMSGRHQLHYKHQVPYEKIQGIRINITWRFIQNHQPGCRAERNTHDLDGVRPRHH